MPRCSHQFDNAGSAKPAAADALQVYGDPLEHPQTETYWGNVNCIGERSCYDEGKRAAECLTFDYKREHNTDVRQTCCPVLIKLHAQLSNQAFS
jgi:nucleoside-diphosphate-sugar epimerase